MAVCAGEVKLLSSPAHMSSIRLPPISDTSAMQNVICNGNIGAGLRSIIYKIFILVKLCLVHFCRFLRINNEQKSRWKVVIGIAKNEVRENLKYNYEFVLKELLAICRGEKNGRTF
jgi:hypothetical protein